MTVALRRLLSDLPEFDTVAAAVVRERAAQVIRPAGALARLDQIAVHVAGWRATTEPAIASPSVLVFAADHGVAAAGVSAYPADVTAAMLDAVRSGRASVNAMASAAGASVTVVDVGVGGPTADIKVADALDRKRADTVVEQAIATVDGLADAGSDLLVLGELGIGNTTVAAAVASAVLGASDDWVGRGTGVDDEGLERKRAAVAAATRRFGSGAPLDALGRVGGAELLAMAAACARARHHRIPVLLDGYVVTAAVLPLHAAVPGAVDHCLAGHVSAEPGHRRLLDHLGLTPLLDLGMRLGEGSGAVAALPVVRMACAAVVDVPTFGEWFDS